MRKWHDGIEEVRRLRQNGKSLIEICLATGVSKSTVYGWIKDLPIPVVDGIDIQTRARSGRSQSPEQIERRVLASKRTWEEKRDKAYEMGKNEANDLIQSREIRDFVCLYIAEGTKRSRCNVSVINTDPKIISLCSRIISRFANRKVWYRLFCSEDEREKLLKFWSEVLMVDPDLINFQLKKKINGRRAEFGLLSVGTSDTYLRSRLQAWIDRVRWEWDAPIV